MMNGAIIVQLLACAVLVVPPLFGLLDKWLITFGMLLLTCGLGILMPISMAAAMSMRPSNAGQTAAMLGFMQMMCGTAGTVLANAGVDLAATVGMQLVMTAFTVLVLIALRVKTRPIA
jgi:hypothetical protein